MSSASNLFVGIVAGALGVAYFVYGKRQEKIPFIVTGICLCIYPYFFESLLWLCLVGIVLAALPMLLKHCL